jgi:hypothetical protein
MLLNQNKVYKLINIESSQYCKRFFPHSSQGSRSEGMLVNKYLTIIVIVMTTYKQLLF